MKKVSNEKIIRVLQIGMHDQIGGVETYLMNYYRNIDKNHIQFDFISSHPKLCFENEIVNMHGKVYHLPSEKRNPFKYFFQMKQIMLNYDIVHINMLSAANILPIVAAKKAGVKNIIVHSHNSNTPSGLLRKILNFINKSYLKNNATDYWACSKLAGEWLFGKKDNMVIIPNAVDTNVFKHDVLIRNEIRKKLNINNNFVIGHIGRFSYQKNHEFLIDMFKMFEQQNPNSILLLIGEGELKDNIIKKVKEYGLNKKVIFAGVTDKVFEYLNAMDVFVLPSRFEGLPVVGVEAQSVGINCVFSSSISKELKINDNVTFVPLDCSLWVESINKLKNKKIKVNNILNNYDISKEVKKLEERYKEMQGYVS